MNLCKVDINVHDVLVDLLSFDIALKIKKIYNDSLLNGTLEDQIFSYSKKDYVQEGVYKFYCCKMLHNVGHIKIGAIIPVIFVDFNNSRIHFNETKIGNPYTRRLSLSIIDE